MKAVLERGALLKTMSHVQSVVERRNTIPILANVLIRGEGDTLSFAATDLDIEVTESTTATIEKAGAVTANAQMLHEIVRKLPEGAEVQLSVEVGDDKLHIRAGRSKFTLATLPVEDFPALATGDYDHQFEINAGALARLFEKTKFAISQEETRYYLNGVYMHCPDTEEKRLRTVATDGHRLAQIETPCPPGAEAIPGVIVPRKCVNELRKILEDEQAVAQVALSEAKIRFSCDGIVLTSKVIDGTFPDYTRVIPKNNTRKLEADAKTFANAVDRVSTVSSEKSRAVKLSLDEDKLVLSVNSPDSGSADEEMVVAYADEAMEIGFNAKYLLEIVGQIDRENAVFYFADSSQPTLVREGDDDSAVYVVMPMRV